MRLAQETDPARKLVGSLFALSLLFGLLSLTFQYFLPVGLVKLSAAGAAGAVVGLLIFAYPKYGLLAAVFYIYADLTYIFGMHLSYPMVVVVVLAVFFRLLRGDRLRGPSTAFGAAAAIFALMAIGSMLFSYDVGISMASFSQYAKVIVMVYLVVHLLRTPDDLDLFALVIFLGNIASVILGVLMLVFVGFGDAPILGQYGGMLRFVGTHVNPNLAAAFMISALPMGAYLMIRARRALYRLALGVGMLVLFTGVVFTFSRQGIFSLVFVLVAILVREVRSRKIYLATFATVVMSILLTPQLYWVRILSIGELFSGPARSSDWSFLLRVIALKKAWSLFLENPLTGVGMNNFVVRAGSDLFVKIGVHNMYLEILVGMGVFGFLAFLMVHLFALRLFRRTILQRDRTDRIGRFAFYFLLAYVATMISGLFQSITFYYVIWLPLAGGLAATRIARDQRGPTGAVSVKLNSS